MRALTSRDRMRLEAIVSGIGLLFAAAALPGDEGQERSAESWKRQCADRLVRANSQQQQAAKDRVHNSLASLRQQLKNMPNGVVLAREMGLEELSQQLATESCDAAVLSRVERSLEGIWPSGIQANVNALRRDTALLAAIVGLTPEQFDNARTALTRLVDCWKNPAADDRERILREAYAQIAATRLVDDLLVTVRREVSRPNMYMLVTRDYIESVGAKEFTVPVRFTRDMGQGSVAVRGSVGFKIATSLPENPQAASVRIGVSATGQAQVSGQRDRIRASAHARVSAHAAESLQLDSNGIHTNPLALNVSTSTSLNSLDLGMRCRLGSRVANRLVSRVASNRLAEADPQIAASIKQQTTTRVDDECADIAYRINGLFRTTLWERLFARDLSSSSRFWTNRDGIWSSAEFHQHEQLGATSAPPRLPTEIAAGNEIAFWLHESAINNLTDALAGRRFDETTFLEILQEELKLGSRSLDALPKPRIAAALVFANERPLQVSFSNHGLELAIRVQACEAEGATINRHVGELRVRYELSLSASGVGLQRVGSPQVSSEAAVDPLWLSVIERFLPAEIHSLPRYRNGSFSHYMQLQHLDLCDGWLVVSARREAATAAASLSAVSRRAN